RMTHADFVHLHNHSDYSLLDGASPIPAMVRRAAELQMPALALTHHGAVFGAVGVYHEARRARGQPILGMEAYRTPGPATSPPAPPATPRTPGCCSLATSAGSGT